MLLDHNHNSSCKFAEDIIDYLYGEINTSEKLRFEQHLTGCNSCTSELAGFSMVRTNVFDWQKKEFSNLPTPVIEIPYEQNIPIRNLVSETNNSPNWVSNIREFFNFSPIWTTAITGCAVLLVCIGLFFIFFNSQTTDDRASANKNESNEKVQTTPTIDNKNSNTKVLDTNLTGDGNNKTNNSESDKSEVTNEKQNRQINRTAPIKVSTTSNPIKESNIKPSKIYTNNGNKVVNKTPNNSTNKTNRPTLSGEDDEKETLRLSDIFEEIGMR